MPPSEQPDQQRIRLANLLNEIAATEGTYQSNYQGIELTRLLNPSGRAPCVYKPGILIVAQGRKRGYVGDEVLPYDPYNYLVLTAPMAFECDYDCSAEEPLLAAMIDVDPAVVSELLLEMEEPVSSGPGLPRAIISTPLNDRVGGAVIRLLECLQSTRECKVLAPQMVREVIYHVLTGDQGHVLKSLVARDDHANRINRVLNFIHENPAEEFSAESLARKAGMSVKTFHKAFKEVTATSPIQYIKRIRLDRARRLMAHEGHTAGSAATKVGYESPSQFSREFKRLFGASPVAEAMKLRKQIGPGAQA